MKLHEVRCIQSAFEVGTRCIERTELLGIDRDVEVNPPAVRLKELRAWF